MKFNIIQPIILFFSVIILACQEEVRKSDAYGNFEVPTTIVSSKARGQLLFLHVDEGQLIEKGQLVGLVDTVQLDLERSLYYAQLSSINSKKADPIPEMTIYRKQKANLERERDRFEKLVEAKAATQKQLDDIEGEIEVINQKIESALEMASTKNVGILADKDPIRAKINLVEQQIKDCYVYQPSTGKVINKLSETSEVVNFGTPLYSFADLSTITLRAYTEAYLLDSVRLNDVVTVLVDAGQNGMRKLEGVITWMADEAEFTPKTIQTKEERVHLVYAFKVEVVNDGRLKIGMPAEVMFDPNFEPLAMTDND